jgi:guanylate kinase
MGKATIFSAPSGSGKTTVVKHLMEKLSDKLAFSISATTRKPRPTEVDGREYYFLSLEDFKARVKNNEFIEHEEVYPGIFYGTLQSEVQRIWDENKAVIFDVDVKGGLSLKEKLEDDALAIFLRPPSVEELIIRLRKRSTEVEHELQQRIAKANYELTFEKSYDTVIINDILEDTYKTSVKTVNDFLNK